LSPNFLLYSLVCLMVLCWSGNYVAAKIVFRELPAMIVMCLRTIVAGVLIIPIYWFQARKKPTIWTWGEFWLLFALGVIGITMNQFFWTLGVERTTVVHSSMIMATTPLFVLLMAGIMQLERITVLKVIGIVTALCGVALLQLVRSTSSAHGPTFLGDFLTLLCALLLAGTTALGKRYKPVSGGIAVNAVGYVGGSLLLLPVLWWSAQGFNFAHVSAAAWTGVFYMGAFSSITGYLIYYYALARIPASRMAAFQYLQPVFASLMAVVLLGEQLSGTAIAAGAIIFTGVFVTERFG
jgi:drug/metabolite transporter (DMT)-like permease